MGRPKIEITDEQLRQAELLAGYGLTQDQIADVLGIAHRTFARKQDEPRVLAALQKGRAEAQHKIGKSIFEKALKGDMTAAIWWEKTRAGRHEKVVQEHQGKGVEINIGRAAPSTEDKRDTPRRSARGTGRLKAV
jgi:hypothetical protein